MFITKIEGGNTTNEGLCLVCAKELGVMPVDDIMKHFGVTDDDLEAFSEHLSAGDNLKKVDLKKGVPRLSRICSEIFSKILRYKKIKSRITSQIRTILRTVRDRTETRDINILIRIVII